MPRSLPLELRHPVHDVAISRPPPNIFVSDYSQYCSLHYPMADPKAVKMYLIAEKWPRIYLIYTFRIELSLVYAVSFALFSTFIIKFVLFLFRYLFVYFLEVLNFSVLIRVSHFLNNWFCSKIHLGTLPLFKKWLKISMFTLATFSIYLNLS